MFCHPHLDDSVWISSQLVEYLGRSVGILGQQPAVRVELGQGNLRHLSSPLHTASRDVGRRRLGGKDLARALEYGGSLTASAAPS